MRTYIYNVVDLTDEYGGDEAMVYSIATTTTWCLYGATTTLQEQWLKIWKAALP